MNKKIVVFDVDDILWSLNEKAAKLANIPYEKLITFNVPDNPLLNEDEKARLIEVYNSDELFAEMNFYDGVNRLNTLDADVRIVSNVFSKGPANQKLTNLRKVIRLPYWHIRLNMVTDPYSKELPEDTYIFVDDSPYNISKSKAKYNIMLKKPWNVSEHANEIMREVPRVQFDTLNEIIDYIETLLK